MNKESWLKLANAWVESQVLERELTDAIDQVIQEKGSDFERDFRGLPYYAGALVVGASDVLGEDFSYWYYDCGRDFGAFNKNTTLADGTHPDVHSLEEMFEYAKDKETGLVTK